MAPRQWRARLLHVLKGRTAYAARLSHMAFQLSATLASSVNGSIFWTLKCLSHSRNWLLYLSIDWDILRVTRRFRFGVSI